MTTNSWPHRPDFDGDGNPVPGTGQTTEEQYGRLFENFSLNGIAGTPGDTRFRVFGDVGGMQVRVDATGSPFAIIRGVGVELTAEETLTIAAAGAGTRVDRVVLRSDLAARTVTPVVKTGVNGSSTPPALTWGGGVYEIPLALVTVAGGAVTIDPSAVVDDRRFLGSDVGIWTTDTRPPLEEGTLGLNVTTGRFEGVLNGAWSNITPAVTWGDISGKPSIYPTNWANVSDKPATFAPAAHSLESHSGDLAWTRISGKPATYPAASHTHDDRYFTESEVNQKIGAITRESLGIPNWSPSSSAGSGTLVSRDSNGLFGIQEPTAWNHPATKSQVDGVNGRVDGVVENLGRTRDGYRNAAIWSRILTTNYRSVYIQSDGTEGHVGSSFRFKQNIEDRDIDLEAVRSLRLKQFRYRRAVNELGEDAPVEVGLIAEDVEKAGLDWLLYRDEQGRAAGIEYAHLALALLPVLQDQERRIAELERRLEGQA